MNTRSVTYYLLGTALLLLGACSPARTGLVGDTLTTNVRPTVSIAPGPRMELMGGGKLWVSIPADSFMETASATFDYATYTSPANDNTRGFALAAIAKLQSPGQWRFDSFDKQVEGLLPVQVTTSPAGLSAETQLLAISSTKDWSSALLQQSNRPVPATWLAIRWTAPVDDDTRIAAEYREPWPACLGDIDMQFPFFNTEQNTCLYEFLERARVSIVVNSTATEFPASYTQPKQLPLPQKTSLDVQRLVGKAIRIDNITIDSNR